MYTLNGSAAGPVDRTKSSALRTLFPADEGIEFVVYMGSRSIVQKEEDEAQRHCSGLGLCHPECLSAGSEWESRCVLIRR